jgi:hypothetical protein
MTATTTPLAELMAMLEELRRLDDDKLLAAWSANETAIARPGRFGSDDQARFRHDAFRLAALERFGFAHQHASIAAASTRSRPRPLPGQPPACLAVSDRRGEHWQSRRR